MSFWDRVQEVIPHTGRAWVGAVVIAAVLVVLIFVALPRLVKRPWLRWGIAAVLLLIAGWLTVLPVFFDKEVNEQLLGVSTAPASAPTTSVSSTTTQATPDPPATTTTTTAPAGPV